MATSTKLSKTLTCKGLQENACGTAKEEKLVVATPIPANLRKKKKKN